VSRFPVVGMPRLARIARYPVKSLDAQERETVGIVENGASWFDGIDPDGVRGRLRANLEVAGVEPFWEDRLYAADRPVAFRIGDRELLGEGPCNRCVVPTRDPRIGEETDGFRERFLERREATLPGWAPEERFDHFYKVMVNTRVPEDGWGRSIAVGDDVEVLGPAE